MLKNRVKLLTIICATLQITNTYCMFNSYDSILELYNNNSNNNYYIDDIMSFSNDEQSINQNNPEEVNDMFFGINDSTEIIEFNNISNQNNIINQNADFIENNNQQNIIVDLSSNNNENKKVYLGKKSKRFIAKKTGTNIQNVKLNYKEFVNINKIIKHAIPGNIEKLKAEYYDTLYIPTNTQHAEYCLKQIEHLTKLENDKFPILDNLNITNVNYTGFKVQNTVQKVKNLKDIIKNMIDYEDKNCELKSKDHKKLKEILEKMQNDEMTKQMFNALRNIGVIVRNPNRIRFFKDKKQQYNLFKLNGVRKDFEDICNSDDNNVLKESTKKLYDTIMNNTYMDLLFNKHSGFTKIISKRFMPVMTKILTKMNSSGLNKDFIKFKFNRANTTFDLMEQRLINGEEAIFDYDKTPKENKLEFYTYYNNMLEKTELFLPSISKEKKDIFSVINALKNYDCKIKEDKKIYVSSELELSKLNTIKVLTDFLENNGNKALDEWYKKLKLKSNEIFKKSWNTYIKKTDLKELLTTFEIKINNGNKSEVNKDISIFIEQLPYYKERLSHKKTSGDIIKILQNILTNDSCKNFITNDFVKNLFAKQYNTFCERYDMCNLDRYYIRHYSSYMKVAYIKAIRMSKVFLYLSQTKNSNYPDELKNILLNYYNLIKESANNESNKYKYSHKFINNNAIVPA